MPLNLYSQRAIVALAFAFTIVNPVYGLVINFSYQFDTQGFFDLQPRRDALEAAADRFEVFTDSLTAISPGGVNTWTAIFDHPGMADVNATVVDLSIGSDTLVVYAGGRNHSGSTVGVGGFGGYSSFGSDTFNNSVATRGQPNSTGAAPTDFARWGGAISFDTLTSNGQTRNWHTDLNTAPQAGASDLYSVALHELGHLFGFAATSPDDPPISFQTWLDEANHLFDGPMVDEVYGLAAPTAANGSSHWHQSVTSTVNGSSQTAVMVPSVPAGVRRFFTALDYAAMADIGWQVPESVFDTPLPGDYDGSGSVNSTDFAVWRRAFGSTTSLAADGNGNLRIDAADYTVWRNRLGATNGSGTSSSVPEPAGLLMGTLGGLSVMYLAFCGGLRTTRAGRRNSEKSSNSC